MQFLFCHCAPLLQTKYRCIHWLKQQSAFFSFFFSFGSSALSCQKKRKEKTPLVVMTQPAWLRDQTIKKKLMWVRGGVCRSTRTQSLTVVACVILQCIPCFYGCRCMSDRVFVQFVCQLLNLMVIQIKVCQRFVCIVFVDSSHSSNEDHAKLDFPISLSV